MGAVDSKLPKMTKATLEFMEKMGDLKIERRNTLISSGTAEMGLRKEPLDLSGRMQRPGYDDDDFAGSGDEEDIIDEDDLVDATEAPPGEFNGIAPL